MELLARHRLVHAPRRAIGEVPEGEVARLVGRAVQLGEVLEAPLSGRPCLYYKVWVARPLVLLSTTLAHEERGVMFALEDGTGRAVVDPDGCTLDLVVDERNSSGTSGFPTGRQVAVLTRFTIEVNEWTDVDRSRPAVPLPRDFIYREAIIGVGETIAILGGGVREPDPHAEPDGSYRGAQPTRLRMSGSREHPLIISDHPSTTQ